MNKTRDNENPFIKEVEDASYGNPYVDMDLFRQWQEMGKILASLPKEPEPKPKKVRPFPVRPFRLQSIPLEMFGR